jgi:ankyrin repeat protein
MAVELCAGNVTRLLESLEDIDGRTAANSTALHIAAQGELVGSVRSLILHKASVTAKDRNKKTPLDIASGLCKRILARILPVSATACGDENLTEMPNSSKVTSLHEVSDMLHEGMKVQLADGFKDEMDASGGPLQPGEEGVIRHINYANKQPVNVERSGRTWWYTLKALSPSDFSQSMGWSLLMLAAEDGNLEIIETLLGENSDIHAKTTHQETALHLATSGKQTAAVHALIEARAHIEAEDCQFRTPLHIAAMRGSSDIIKILLAKKTADNVSFLEHPDFKQYSALHYAASTSAQSVCLLVEAQANVDARDSTQRTALHLAAQTGSLATLRALVNMKADCNLKDNEGNTPFELAKTEQCKYALKVIGSGGFTPLMVAAERRGTEVRQYLNQYTLIYSTFKSIKTKESFSPSLEEAVKKYLSLGPKLQKWIWGPHEKKLILSDDKERIKKNFPSHPDYSCVLGSEELEEGIHFWEVTVENVRSMWIGIARGVEENNLLSSCTTRPGEDGCLLAFNSSGGYPEVYGSKHVKIRSIPDSGYMSGDKLTFELDSCRHVLKMRINDVLAVIALDVDDREVRPYVCMDYEESVTLGERFSRVLDMRTVSEDELSGLNNSLWTQELDFALKELVHTGLK